MAASDEVNLIESRVSVFFFCFFLKVSIFILMFAILGENLGVILTWVFFDFRV